MFSTERFVLWGGKRSSGYTAPHSELRMPRSRESRPDERSRRLRWGGAGCLDRPVGRRAFRPRPRALGLRGLCDGLGPALERHRCGATEHGEPAHAKANLGVARPQEARSDVAVDAGLDA